MVKGYVVNLAGDELLGLIEVVVHELKRQESHHPTVWDAIMQRVLAKLGQLHPDGLALAMNPPGLPARMTREIFKVIADPTVLQTATDDLRRSQRNIDHLLRELKRARKSKVTTPRAVVKTTAGTARAAKASTQPDGIPPEGKLHPNIGRRLGGLRRAAQAAEARGDSTSATNLRERAKNLEASATAAWTAQRAGITQ